MQKFVSQNAQSPEIDVMSMRSTEDHLRWKVIQRSAIGCPPTTQGCVRPRACDHEMKGDSPTTRCMYAPTEISNLKFPVQT